jgi:hypothetical protein
MEAERAISVSRDQMYDLIREVPMVRLAAQFSLSGTGLAKICRRFEVPYPPCGYWAKVAAGKEVVVAPLPPPSPGTPDSVRTVPTERPVPPTLPEKVPTD